MIRSLTGTVTGIGDGYATISVHGVGYLVGTNTVASNFTEGQIITVHTHLAVRENSLDLYGFSTTTELDFFELLIDVPKVGPKSALQILTLASPTLLLEAIGKKDPQYLHKLSGIGKKTCENIVQYLHDKTSKLEFAPEIAISGGFSAHETDAIDALVALGYDITSARESVKELATPEATTNQIITAALKQLD